MKIAQKFNRFTFKEYFFYIDNHKKYTDFNILGLYRSILENEKLTIEEKIEVRDYAHKLFKKQFDFLQLKDPHTFIQNTILGLDLTEADKRKVWNDVMINQQKILANKRIKHRNFGVYSKHYCGDENCNWNGLMVKQGSWLSESEMHFYSDKNKYACKEKSEKRLKQRKSEKQIIDSEINIIN